MTSCSSCKKTSDRCHITMSACFVSFILFPVTVYPKISPILFLNGKLRKTAVNLPNFWVLVKISHLLLSNFIVQTFSLHFSKQWAVLWIWKTISIIITMIWYVLTWIKSWHFLKEHKNWKIISSFDCVTKMSGLNGFRLDPA